MLVLFQHLCKTIIFACDQNTDVIPEKKKQYQINIVCPNGTSAIFLQFNVSLFNQIPSKCIPLAMKP